MHGYTGLSQFQGHVVSAKGSVVMSRMIMVTCNRPLRSSVGLINCRFLYFSRSRMSYHQRQSLVL